MQTELEAKFFPVNKEEIRGKLKEVGAKLEHPERVMKRVIFDRRTNPSVKPNYIRVRDEGNIIKLSAKVHADRDGKMSDQKECDVVVDDFDKTVEILELAGLKKSHYQETTRETWSFKNAKITIDTWPGLEPYVEVEAESEKIIKEVALDLGLDWDGRRVTSVTEIFAEVYGVDDDESLFRLSYTTFDKPAFG